MSQLRKTLQADRSVADSAALIVLQARRRGAAIVVPREVRHIKEQFANDRWTSKKIEQMLVQLASAQGVPVEFDDTLAGPDQGRQEGR